MSQNVSQTAFTANTNDFPTVSDLFLFSPLCFLQILIPLQHNQTNSTSTSKTSSQPIPHPPSHSPIPIHPSTSKAPLQGIRLSSLHFHIPPFHNTQKPPNHSSQPFRHRHGLIRANHCAFRFTIPHQKSLIINLSIMPAEKMSKKHQCVADGVFYAELDEVGAVFPPDSSY